LVAYGLSGVSWPRKWVLVFFVLAHWFALSVFLVRGIVAA